MTFAILHASAETLKQWNPQDPNTRFALWMNRKVILLKATDSLFWRIAWKIALFLGLIQETGAMVEEVKMSYFGAHQAKDTFSKAFQNARDGFLREEAKLKQLQVKVQDLQNKIEELQEMAQSQRKEQILSEKDFLKRSMDELSEGELYEEIEDQILNDFRPDDPEWIARAERIVANANTILADEQEDGWTEIDLSTPLAAFIEKLESFIQGIKNERQQEQVVEDPPADGGAWDS